MIKVWCPHCGTPLEVTPVVREVKRETGTTKPKHVTVTFETAFATHPCKAGTVQ